MLFHVFPEGSGTAREDVCADWPEEMAAHGQQSQSQPCRMPQEMCSPPPLSASSQVPALPIFFPSCDPLTTLS